MYPTLNCILFLSPLLQNRICGTSGCDADSLQAQIKLWSLQSNVTYVASPAQSWIDDYFAWLNSGQCCKYDENTLEVRSERSSFELVRLSSGNARTSLNKAFIWH